MGPKNRATNWPYNRFGTISDGTITGMHCIAKFMERCLFYPLMSKGQKKRVKIIRGPGRKCHHVIFSKNCGSKSSKELSTRAAYLHKGSEH